MATKKTTQTKKAPVKRPVRAKAKKVDIYPNRMALAIAATAAVSLVLFGVLAFYT